MINAETLQTKTPEAPERPSRPLDRFIWALGEIHAGTRDRIDLVSAARDITRTKTEVYSALVKQVSLKDGIVFPDDQIYIDLKEFMAGLTGGKDVMKEFQAMNLKINPQTSRTELTTEHATNVDRSQMYVHTIIWEIPTVHPNIVIGLSINADETGVLSHSYYIGLPYSERVGLRAFKRTISRAVAQFFPPQTPVHL